MYVNYAQSLHIYHHLYDICTTVCPGQCVIFVFQQLTRDGDTVALNGTHNLGTVSFVRIVYSGVIMTLLAETQRAYGYIHEKSEYQQVATHLL